MGENTSNIILLHLSEENNRPELARKLFEERIKRNTNIYISTQKERTEVISV